MTIDPNLAGSSCQGSLISFGSSPGRTLDNTLFHSHPYGPGRTRMVVRRSDDGGRSWPHALEIYKGGAAYSCLSPMPTKFGDTVGLMFERDGEQCTQGVSERDTAFPCASAFILAKTDAFLRGAAVKTR